MKNRSDYQAYSLPGHTTRRYGHHALALAIACGFSMLTACTTNRNGAANGQSIRLNVGEIKEISMATRSDTTWQLSVTSDNQEVVDVSRKPAMIITGNESTAAARRQPVFLIKGVTIGTAKVVFAEKQIGADGDGQVKKTYRVTVVSK